MSLGCYVGGRPLYLVHLLCIFLFFSFFIRLFAWTVRADVVFFFFFLIVKDCPELESRFAERVCVAIEYASTIDDFDDLVDPKTLAHHCLGPETSIMSFVLSVVKKKVSFFRMKVDRPSFPFFSHSSFLH